MEPQAMTADETVIQTLAIGKMNLEIENARLKHRLAELEAQSTETNA